MEKQIKFSKKQVYINDFSEMKNIKKLLKKNEDVIINYLERVIYTSKLSDITKTEINEIFKSFKV